MEESKIRSIVQNELQKYASNNQYGVSKIPIHTHNGTDSVKIQQKDIVNNNKYAVEIISSDSLTAGGETFTLSNLPNITQMFFNGFASNNAANLTLPGTLKAAVVGNVQFGNCFQTPNATGQLADLSFANVVDSFTQNSSAIFIDTTSLANARVLASGVYFVYVENAAGTVVATAKMVSYDNSTITITTTLAAGWEITGFYILT